MNPQAILGIVVMSIGAIIFGTGLAKGKEKSNIAPVEPVPPAPSASAPDPTNPGQGA